MLSDTPSLVTAALALLSALLYLGSSARQVLKMDRHRAKPEAGVLWLSIAAVALHFLAVLSEVHANGLSLGFYRIASVIFLAMSIVSLVLLLIRPLQMVMVVMFPLAALSVLVAAFGPATGEASGELSTGVISHVTLSVVAYGLLTLAALQSALVLLQNNRLRQHQTHGIVRALPPLQLMETMFFELLAMGSAVLTAAIVAGALYVDDLFAQHLVHKTVLTIIAWAMFSTVLIVEKIRGWRVHTAVVINLVGYGIMALGFFGSKLVLELLIN